MLHDAIMALIFGVSAFFCSEFCQYNSMIWQAIGAKIFACLFFYLSGYCFGIWFMERKDNKK